MVSGSIFASYVYMFGTVSSGYDGSACGYVTKGATSDSASLTTSSSPDVLLLAISLEPNTSVTVSGVSDTTGLHWVSRTSLTYSTTGTLDEYYAISTGPLSADSITATFSGGSPAEMCVAAFAGANTTSPFESGFPVSASGSGSSASVSISTTNSNDFLFSAAAATGNNTWTSPTGFTSIASRLRFNPTYEIVTSPQSNLAVTYGISSSSLPSWAVFVDAVRAASSSGGGGGSGGTTTTSVQTTGTSTQTRTRTGTQTSISTVITTQQTSVLGGGCSGFSCFPQYITPFENYTTILIIITIVAVAGIGVWFARRK